MVKHITKIVFILVAVQLTMMAAVWFITDGGISLSPMDMMWLLVLTLAGCILID